MMRTYADYNFYGKEYLGLSEGEEPPVKEADFLSYAMEATKRIRYRTNGNIQEGGKIPEAVSMCCCEMVDRCKAFDQLKDKNGRILQSYSNDGDRIIREWLTGTGLLFCGVRR